MSLAIFNVKRNGNLDMFPNLKHIYLMHFWRFPSNLDVHQSGQVAVWSSSLHSRRQGSSVSETVLYGTFLKY